MAQHTVLFDGTNAAGNFSLGETDGTATGTFELTGIAGAAAGIHPFGFTLFRGEVLFNGVDTAGHNGLWVTDGTAAGTHELTGIVGARTSGFGLDPGGLTPFNGEVLFDGRDVAGNDGLWVTDGTAAGTHELTGIAGAFGGGVQPTQLTVLGGEVLFAGKD